MYKKLISLIYRIFLSQGGKRIPSIEQHLNLGPVLPVSEDDVRNASTMHSALFSEEGRSEVENLYLTLMSKMRGVPFDECMDALEGLIFLQEVIATALWKYESNVGQRLERFARDFDRLDVPEEKFRLYQAAQVERGKA